MNDNIGVTKPYHRNARQFTDGSYSNSGQSRYIVHPKYAQSPAQYVRAFLLIQKDLLNLFDYIEPADINLKSYSFRIHELLVRSCIEIEANFKAILIENGKIVDLNMTDYKVIEKTHKLSGYIIKFPYWHGEFALRRPFEIWGNTDLYSQLNWYKAYNETKHNRHNGFKDTNFVKICFKTPHKINFHALIHL